MRARRRHPDGELYGRRRRCWLDDHDDGHDARRRHDGLSSDRHCACEQSESHDRADDELPRRTARHVRGCGRRALGAGVSGRGLRRLHELRGRRLLEALAHRDLADRFGFRARQLRVEERHVDLDAIECTLLLQASFDGGLHLRAVPREELGYQLSDRPAVDGLARGNERLDIGTHRGGGGVAIGGLQSHGLGDDGEERRIRVRRHGEGRRNVAARKLLEDLEIVHPLPQSLAGDRPPENYADGVDVGPAIDLRLRSAGAELLRRHVGHLALDDPCARHAGRVGRLGDAEIEDLDDAVVGDENVLR